MYMYFSTPNCIRKMVILISLYLKEEKSMKTTDIKGAFSMRALEMVEFLDSAARNFRKSYMNEANTMLGIEQDVLDAIVVDFINSIAASQCIDYALYTEDLQKADRNQERDWYLDFKLTKDILRSRAEKYKCEGICKSVMTNNHMNNVQKEFANETANMIVDDMVNYIFEQL